MVQLTPCVTGRPWLRIVVPPFESRFGRMRSTGGAVRSTPIPIQSAWLSRRLLLSSIERFWVTARSFYYLKSILRLYYLNWIWKMNIKLKNNTVLEFCRWNDLSVTQMHSNGAINTLCDRQIPTPNHCTAVRILPVVIGGWSGVKVVRSIGIRSR